MVKILKRIWNCYLQFYSDKFFGSFNLRVLSSCLDKGMHAYFCKYSGIIDAHRGGEGGMKQHPPPPQANFRKTC
jgi:hypothetical protein